MFSTINCFGRARVQALGGETVMIVSGDTPEATVVGEAVWEEGYGPTSALAALNLKRPGSAIEIDEGVPVNSESYSLSVWLELPLVDEDQQQPGAEVKAPLGFEKTLAACDSSSFDDLGDDEEAAMVCVSTQGELGVRRERVEGFAGSGFFVDDVAPGWYHVVAVGERGATRFLVNGRGVGSASASIGPNLRLRRVGSRAPTRKELGKLRVLPDECWGGRVADIRLFDRALDNDDVSLLFSGGVMAAAASAAPQLAPKQQRAQRAARARLADAVDIVDDALQMLEAARDLVVTHCVPALPDLEAALAKPVADARAKLAAAAAAACRPHGIGHNDIRDLVDPRLLESNSPVFIVAFDSSADLADLPCPVVPADENLTLALQPTLVPSAFVCDAINGRVITDKGLVDLAELGPTDAVALWTSNAATV